MERPEINSGIDSKRLGEKIRADRERFFDDKAEFIELVNGLGAPLSERKLGRIERGEQCPTISELTAFALTLYLDQWESGLISLLRYSATPEMFLDMAMKSLISRGVRGKALNLALTHAILESIDDNYLENENAQALLARVANVSIPADSGGME